VNDATGLPQTAVVVGGTSEIALATIEALAEHRLERVLLAARDAAALGLAKARLEAAGVRDVQVETCDVTRAEDIERLASRAGSLLDGVDLVLVAAGQLGTADLDGLPPARVLEMMAANAGGPGAAAVAFASLMARQGYGRIVVLSSVAGLRVRRANFVYGAGKAAIDGLALGLGDAVRDSGVSVMVVRPGFVRTKMTAGMPEAPFSIDAPEVAKAIVDGLQRDAAVVYVPPVLRYAFIVLRHLPRTVFRRLPG
jgi:decaprenylphospho-beta-D-erythro-pentofuranosid-2-ulose 2-reductase